MTEESKTKEVTLDETSEIVLPKIDVQKYIGNETKIEKVTEYQGEWGYYVKVETKVIDTIEGGDEPLELRATKILGLQTDKDGKVGWGKDTKMGVFLKHMGVDHYNNLIGKAVKVQTHINPKAGKEYLTVV